MSALIPIGYEFAVEVSYPESEATSSALLNMTSIVGLKGFTKCL